AQPQPAAGRTRRGAGPAGPSARPRARHREPGGRQLHRTPARPLSVVIGAPAGAHAGTHRQRQPAPRAAGSAVTTLITHPLPALALGLALGSKIIPPRLLLAGVLFACLPDAAMLAFKLGIAYADAFGHRGFSHSLLFAGFCGLIGALSCRLFRCGPLQAGLWILLATLSHSLLDALTDGGLGVAWLWPLSQERHF